MERKLPLSVRLIADFCFLSAFCGFVYAGFLLLAFFTPVFTDTDMTSFYNALLTGIAVACVIALAYIAVGIGLLMLQNWSRIAAVILSIVVCIDAFVNIGTFANRQLFIGLPAIAIVANAIVLYFLFLGSSVRAAFRNLPEETV